MSRAIKRKHLQREMWEDDFALPAPEQQIVKILAPRGNNLHEVQTADGEVFLVSMPNKFRLVFWVKKGQYLVIDPIKEGHKVKGEIAKILTKDHIKSYHKDNAWPSAFKDALENHNTYPNGYVTVNQRIKDLDSDSDTDSENKSDKSGTDSDSSDTDSGSSDTDSESERETGSDTDSENGSDESDNEENNCEDKENKNGGCEDMTGCTNNEKEHESKSDS